MDIQIIHIQWDGPFDFDSLDHLDNAAMDYGLYQICGSHPVYGLNSLLYIGKAARQTFNQRISSEWWSYLQDFEGNFNIYVGRISGSSTPTDRVWESEIEKAETLLINAHKPAWNRAHVGFLAESADRRVMKVHVLNWGNYAYLLPEVSGLRWSSRFDYVENYGPYGSHQMAS